MRNFRTAAAASATAFALIVSGTTAAVAETTPEADASDRTVLHTGDQTDSIFKGFEQETDKPSSEIISDAFQGSSEGVGSSRALSNTDTDERFDGRDGFGKETNSERMPQWARIWVDGTIIAAIGAVIGLVIAGVNFAKFNGLLPA